jgi:GNAT superfamily N-acetyltransferase
MGKVRPAVESDLAALVDMGREMHAEAPALRHAAYDAAKTGRALLEAIRQGSTFVHEMNDGALDGAFVGIVIEHWFSAHKMATDLALFVRPGRRGGWIAHLLLDHFIEWCEGRGIDTVQIGITTGVTPEQTGKFYEREGFQFVGGNYQMRLNGHVL